MTKYLTALFFIMTLGAAHANEIPHTSMNTIGRMSCATITGNGWDHMPIEDITIFALANPNSDKLGYGSECHISSLVFAQCFLEPRWLVKQAVDELINKALAGERLPGERVCGA
jgi:hypothetical protein